MSKSSKFCAVLRCTNQRTNKAQPNLRFFAFPKDPELFAKWKQLARQPNIDESPIICSQHFTENDWSLKDRLLKTEFKRRKLKDDAVPSLNLNEKETAVKVDVSPPKLCRLCLKENDLFISLFGKEPKSQTILTKVENTLNFKIKHSKNWPEMICIQCYAKIKTLNDFIAECKSNQLELFTRFGGSCPVYHTTEVINANKEIEFISVKMSKQVKQETRNNSDKREIKEQNPKKEEIIEENHLNGSVNEEVLNDIKTVKSSNVEKGIDYNCDSEIIFEEMINLEDDDEENQENTQLIIETKSLLNKKLDLKKYLKVKKVPEQIKRQNAPGKKRKVTFVNSVIQKSRVLVCQFCSMGHFIFFSDYKKHIQNVHHSNDPFTCCGNEFTEEKPLYQHIMSSSHHLLHESIECQICDKQFHIGEEYLNHKSCHFQCDICSSYFITEKVLRIHKRTHMTPDERRHSCKFCDFKAKNFAILQEHKLISHPEEFKFPCEICSKSFTSVILLRGHISSVHNTGRVLCTGCDSMVKNINKHYCPAKNTEPMDCKLCDKQFKNSSSLYTHIVRMHKKRDNEKLTCHICQKVFTRSSYLKEHIYTHTGESPYKCHFCPRAFRAIASRSIHMNKIHKEKLQLYKKNKPFDHLD